MDHASSCFDQCPASYNTEYQNGDIAVGNRLEHYQPGNRCTDDTVIGIVSHNCEVCQEPGDCHEQCTNDTGNDGFTPFCLGTQCEQTSGNRRKVIRCINDPCHHCHGQCRVFHIAGVLCCHNSDDVVFVGCDNHNGENDVCRIKGDGAVCFKLGDECTAEEVQECNDQNQDDNTHHIIQTDGLL